MACFLPLHKTKKRPKPDEEIYLQSFPQMARCFVSFASQVCPKRKQNILRPRRLVSMDLAALDAWSFRLDFHGIVFPPPWYLWYWTARPFATRTSWEPSWTWWVWLICPLMRSILRIKWSCSFARNANSLSTGFNRVYNALRQDGFPFHGCQNRLEAWMCLNLVLRQIPVVQKRYDTVHGRFKHDVKIGEKDELIVNGNKIKCIQASREGPKALPWKDWVTDNRNNWRVHTSLSNRKRLGMIRYFQCKLFGKATWCYMYMFTVHVKVRSFTWHAHIDVYVCTLGHGRGVCHWVHWSLRGGWEGRTVCW